MNLRKVIKRDKGGFYHINTKELENVSVLIDSVGRSNPIVPTIIFSQNGRNVGFLENEFPSMHQIPKGIHRYSIIPKLVKEEAIKGVKRLIRSKRSFETCTETLKFWLDHYTFKGIDYECESYQTLKNILDAENIREKFYRRIYKFKPDKNTPVNTFFWGRKTKDWISFDREDLENECSPMKNILQHQVKTLMHIMRGESPIIPSRKLFSYLKFRRKEDEPQGTLGLLNSTFSHVELWRLAEKGINPKLSDESNIEFFNALNGRIYQPLEIPDLKERRVKITLSEISNILTQKTEKIARFFEERFEYQYPVTSEGTDS